MNLYKIKILKIDITDILIDMIRDSKQHPDKSKNIWKLNESKDIIEFELKHEDFDFFIDFDLHDNCHIIKPYVDCIFKNYSHVSDIYPNTDMIDFDDDRLEEIYKAVLSHF